MNRFLCFGSLNLDDTYRVAHFVRPGETLAASEMKTFCGGKGLNQSIALANAGATVYHAGCIGADGTPLLEALQQAKVNTDYVRVLQGEKTGHAIIQNTADGENCILLFGGANQFVTKEQIDSTLKQFESSDVLVLQNEINFIPYLIKAAKMKGMRIAFTPAPMQESVKNYPLGEADYILLNETEAKALAASSGSAETGTTYVADKFCAEYPHTRFVFTLGAGGALYAHRQERVFQSAFPATAVDTTAAGDTFTGFFLQSIVAGGTVKEALATAAKAAAVCVTRRGAAASIPTREALCDLK